MKHIGFSGAQRVGKSTLAKLVAERFGLTYADAEIAKTIQRLNLSAKEQYDIETRFWIQQQILDDFEALCKSKATTCVFDRTPLDFIVYMQADILRDFPNHLEQAYHTFEKNCLRAFRMFECFIVQPGIPLTEDAKSAPASPAYMTHYTNIMIGIAFNLHDTYIMPKNILSLEDRIKYVERMSPTIFKKHFHSK